VDGTSWAGWGFEYYNNLQTTVVSRWSGLSGQGFSCFNSPNDPVAFKETMLFTELDGHPIFRRSPASMFASNITTVVRDELLARGIPALSGPTGEQIISIRNGSGGLLPNRNTDMNVVARPNGWGRDDDDFGDDWMHGDLKDMAFFYNHELFEDVTTKGDLK
jgi:hypothetical protein